MKYSKVHLESMGYELAPIVVTSKELEHQLAPVYEKLNISEGQIEAWTGIYERRWWEKGYPLAQGAIAAAKKALAASKVGAKDIEVLIYGSVRREDFEPATAFRVAAELDISSNATIYDISNACLAAMNGIVDIANCIELGQIRAGMVVCCESAREINEIIIKRLLENCTMRNFVVSFATFTGGSGAVAMLLTDGSFSQPARRQLLGGVSCVAPEFHRLCWWRIEPKGDGNFVENVYCDSRSIMIQGVKLGHKTWRSLLKTLEWNEAQVDKVITHQTGSSHRSIALEPIGIPDGKAFFTYPYLGNVGSVSVPITAAIAEEKGFLQPGDDVAFLGYGSGLNCLDLGWKW